MFDVEYVAVEMVGVSREVLMVKSGLKYLFAFHSGVRYLIFIVLGGTVVQWLAAKRFWV